MRIPNGDGGTIYPGLGWVTLAPIAAGWEPITHEVLQNTVDVMNKKLLKRSNGVAWMPTDGYPDGRFSNEIIGKGIGWELDYARSEANYDRIEEILQLLGHRKRWTSYLHGRCMVGRKRIPFVRHFIRQRSGKDENLYMESKRCRKRRTNSLVVLGNGTTKKNTRSPDTTETYR